MRYTIAALVLLVAGFAIGLAGDYPVGVQAYSSLEMMVIGGLMVAVGVAVLLMANAQRGGRDDEPTGHIRP